MSQLLGIIGIASAIAYVVLHPATAFSGFFDKHALVIVSVMPPSIMMMSHNLGDLLLGIKMLASSIFSSQYKTQQHVVQILTATSTLVRSEGLGSIAKVRNIARYELLRDGLSMIVNDFSADEIKHNISARIQSKQARFAAAAHLFENMSRLCPGVGMIGTLFGLIHMLSNIDDPSKLGGGMAMAMVTTLYGLVTGTCIYGPWSEKIVVEGEKILENDMMVLEGVLHIKSKKSSIHLKDIVKTYAGPAQKAETPPQQQHAVTPKRSA